jgi:hypothetical protein
LYNATVTKLEIATERTRLYLSTYKKIAAIAKKRRRSMAQVIEEKFAKT